MYTYTTLASHRLLRIYRTRFQEQHFEGCCDQIKQEIFSIGKGSISDRIIFGLFQVLDVKIRAEISSKRKPQIYPFRGAKLSLGGVQIGP